MLRISRAEMEDAQLITDIKTLAYNDEVNRYLGRDGGPPGYNDVSSQKNIIKNLLAYKILLDDNIIGCFFLVERGTEHIHFEDFCIDPLFQNRGYGYRTLELVLDEYPDIKKITLDTAKFSTKNQYLYEKFGFKKIGETDEEYEYELIID